MVGLRGGHRSQRDLPGGIHVESLGDMVRGAKRGGITDHIAGPHLIPNVGREAMVPAEVVRRHRPAPKKKAPEPEKPSEELLAAVKARFIKHKGKDKKKDRQRSRSRSRRDRSRTRDRKREEGSDKASASSREASPEKVNVKSKEQVEEELRKEARRAAEEAEREAQRIHEQQLKLQELEEAKRKKESLATQRRSKLSGLFALTEDDIDDEEKNNQAQKSKAAKSRQFGDRRQKPDELSALPDARSVVRAMPLPSTAGAAVSRLGSQDSVTALDIDGSGHDHKFARCWKDWDANKKDDPGEIARQFMKVAAIKRRGYGGGRDGQRRSRSRSRGR